MDQDLLIKARSQLLTNVLDYFVQKDTVLGLFLGGSIPAGIADAYSDIDLRVVVTPESHPQFVENRLIMPEQWGDFLFNEWRVGTEHCVSHFRPFGKIDVFYLNLEEFRPSPWYGLPTDVLYDPQGVLADVIGKSRGLPFDVSVEEMNRTIDKGLAAAHEVYRRIRRGEFFYSQTLLEEFRFYLARIDDLLNDRPPQAIPFARLEERVSDSVALAFRQSYGGLERSGLETSLMSLLRAYRRQIVALHDRFSLLRPIENDLHAVDVILGEWHERT